MDHHSRVGAGLRQRLPRPPHHYYLLLRGHGGRGHIRRTLRQVRTEVDDAGLSLHAVCHRHRHPFCPGPARLHRAALRPGDIHSGGYTDAGC